MKFKTGESGLNVREGQTKFLAYTDEFKEIIASHPHLLKDCIDFFKQMDQVSADRFQDERKEIEVGTNIFWIDSYREDNVGDFETRGRVMTFQIKTEDGQEFFVKAIKRGESGYEEIRSSEKMREMVRGLNDVKVVDYLVGYEDENGNSYFVSRWVDARHIDNYLGRLYADSRKLEYEGKADEAGILMQKHKKVEQRLEELKKTFQPITFDFDSHNIFYDENTDEIILFDLHVD